MSSYVDALKRWSLDGQRASLQTNRVEVTPAEKPRTFEGMFDRLQSEVEGQSRRIVAFSGIAGGEGTGTVSLGYAQSLADRGLHVLLILADVHVVRGQDTNTILDLNQLLRQPCTRSSGESGVLRIAGLPTRDVHAAQFFATPEFARWLAEASTVYDQIVLEIPSILGFAEAGFLARLAAGVVLVARADVTTSDELRRARDQFARVDSPVFGVVLNQVRTPPSLLRRFLLPELTSTTGRENRTRE